MLYACYEGVPYFRVLYALLRTAAHVLREVRHEVRRAVRRALLRKVRREVRHALLMPYLCLTYALLRHEIDRSKT